MPLLPIVILLIVLMLLLYLVDMLPGDTNIKLAIRVVLVVGAIIWLLQRFPV